MARTPSSPAQQIYKHARSVAVFPAAKPTAVTTKSKLATICTHAIPLLAVCSTDPAVNSFSTITLGSSQQIPPLTNPTELGGRPQPPDTTPTISKAIVDPGLIYAHQGMQIYRNVSSEPGLKNQQPSLLKRMCRPYQVSQYSIRTFP